MSMGQGRGCYLDDRTHIATITGYGSGGEGVARLDDGRVAFIRGAARGDTCKIEIISERPRSYRAEIVEIIEPSQHRIEPDCNVYKMCGGCDFRHITYEEELRAKLNRVNDAFERIGGFSIRANEIISTGQIDGYRNKAVFHTANLDGRTVIGFYRAGSHEVCPVKRCRLLIDELNDFLSNLWDNPPAGYGEITLRSGCNNSHTTTEVNLDGLCFRISHSSFFQVNNGATLLLFQKARELASLSKNETLVDIYCGVGALTLFIGRDAAYALGVENNPDAVCDARENVRRNGFNHVDFICADAAKWDATDIRPDCVVVDPPRSGLSAAAVRKILEMSPARIVYISCNPATLARDIKRLVSYEARQVCVIDMFPRTANVECCVLLCRF